MPGLTRILTNAQAALVRKKAEIEARMKNKAALAALSRLLAAKERADLIHDVEIGEARLERHGVFADWRGTLKLTKTGLEETKVLWSSTGICFESDDSPSPDKHTARTYPVEATLHLVETYNLDEAALLKLLADLTAKP